MTQSDEPGQMSVGPLIQPPLYEFNGIIPKLGDGVFVAPNAAVIGDVRLGHGASVWFSAVLRGDDMPISVGSDTNIQDGAVVHATEDVAEVKIGRNVIVGHNATLHGCNVEDDALIGMGAIVLDRARIGKGAIVASGALVPPGKHVPSGMLWAGVPGSVARAVTDEDRAFITYAVRHYRRRASQYSSLAPSPG